MASTPDHPAATARPASRFKCENLWQVAFEHLPDSSAILDEDSTFLFWSGSLPFSPPVSSSHARMLGQQIQRVNDTRAPCSFDLELPLPGGESTTFECHLAPLPVREPPSLFLLVLRDVTAARHAVERQRADAERYRSLTETIADVIWTMDLDLRISHVSPSIEPLIGRSVDEMEHLELRDLLAPESFSLAREILLEELRLEGQEDPESSPSRTLDLRMVRADGSTLWCEARLSFLRDDDGRPLGVLGVARDISAWREAQEALSASEEKLKRAQRLEAVGQLAGGVAHDFNNLLTVIIGNVELMLKDLALSDPLRYQAGEISRAADRAAVLTRQLLAFSRRQMMTPEIVDLNQVIQQMADMLGGLVGENIDLNLDLHPDLDSVEVDSSQIELALVNLVLNSREAMPGGGRLVIETANDRLDASSGGGEFEVEPGPYVLLAVTDSGKGIAVAEQAKIFEPFYTTKSAGKGTGLGLSTVYGIVKQSGGYIWVSSRPGQGTRFEIFLPRVESSEQPVGAPYPSGTRAEARTILVVEDEKSVRTLARHLLQQHGYRVMEAAGGAEALEILRATTSRVDLLLSDVVMPGVGGFELARQAASARPELKVLLMSGHHEDVWRKQQENDPAIPLLRKPFSSSELLQIVDDTLGDCELRQSV